MDVKSKLFSYFVSIFSCGFTYLSLPKNMGLSVIFAVLFIIPPILFSIKITFSKNLSKLKSYNLYSIGEFWILSEIEINFILFKIDKWWIELGCIVIILIMGLILFKRGDFSK